MRGLGKFGEFARRFGKARGGNFGMMAAIIAPGLALAAGYGLNIAQLSMVRSNLLSALDSAVTSTARDLTTGVITGDEARERVEAFLLANARRGFAATERIELDGLTVDPERKTISASASVEVDLAFAVFDMAGPRRIGVESAAIYSDKPIEVAMMLDVTGSMKKKSETDDKIGDLQKAAKKAVTSLLSYNKGPSPRVRVALVPYANSVNVGKAIAEASVFVERSAADRKQASSSNDPLLVTGAPRPDNCATERKGHYQYRDDGPTASMVNRDYLLDGFANSFRNPEKACPDAEIVPLTASQSRLEAAIDGFEASGGTAGHIGIQWTWYMLSERWAGVVGASAAPARRDAGKVGKYAILMTDGEFNLSYFDIATAGEAYNDKGKEATRDSATKLCEEMRKAGIEIFTIGFKLTDDKAKETMSSCASPDTGWVRHYFEASTGEELEAAFETITRNIETLALTR